MREREAAHSCAQERERRARAPALRIAGFGWLEGNGAARRRLEREREEGALSSFLSRVESERGFRSVWGALRGATMAVVVVMTMMMMTSVCEREKERPARGLLIGRRDAARARRLLRLPEARRRLARACATRSGRRVWKLQGCGGV